MNTDRFKQLLESSLGNSKPLLSESLDSGCLRGAGFTRESIGGPMTRRMVYEKTHNGITYQIGITGNDTPTSELKLIKNGTTQYCSWSCDSSSPIGIKYSGCKVEERPLHEQEDEDNYEYEISAVDCGINDKLEYHWDGEDKSVFEKMRGSVDIDDETDTIIIKYCKGLERGLPMLKHKGKMLLKRKYEGVDFSDDDQDSLSKMRGYFGEE
jgi:hypothetical protein